MTVVARLREMLALACCLETELTPASSRASNFWHFTYSISNTSYISFHCCDPDLSMAPPISYTSIDLTVPLFDCQFDPYNRGYLVVGGGGGENKSGVANTIVWQSMNDSRRR